MDNATTAPPPEDRDGFRFRGGCDALDLTATLQARLLPAPRELLVKPADLDRWLVSSGLAGAEPGATEADLVTARALREAVFTVATGLGAAPLDRDACEVLNRLAELPGAVPVLMPDGDVTLRGPAAALLATLAREAIHLFGGEDARKVRQCQSRVCTIFFVDTSRSGRRRWCSMAGCGNRAKVTGFRQRQRDAVQDP